MADYTRARAIFELGTSQQPLSYPENLWKSYIDFEFEQGEREKTRALYERLVKLSGHVKVWRAFAEFEASEIPMSAALREDEEEEEEEEEKTVPGDIGLARQVFERGYRDLKNRGLKEEVCILFVRVNTEKLILGSVLYCLRLGGTLSRNTAHPLMCRRCRR